MKGVRLAAEGLRAGYGRLEVLHGIDAVFPPGAITAVLGPNGAGKTTLLRVLAGQLRPAAGRVSWDGTERTGSPLARSRAGLSYVPAEGKVFEALSVQENLRLFGGDQTGAALALFPRLAGRLHQPAGTLSGGERQMLALSRIAMARPRILLADEVSEGLAPAVTTRVYRALRDLAAQGTTVVVVDQFAAGALAGAAVAYVMRRGAIAFAGEPTERALARALG